MNINLEKVLQESVFQIASRIGTRPIGSPGNRRTREYLRNEITRLGFPVSLQHFETNYSYSERSTVLTQDGRLLDSWPAFASRAADRLAVPIVDCGFGSPEEIPSQIVGKIGVVKRGRVHEEQKVKNLASAGAAGALLYVEYENALYSARVSKSTSLIPAAIIRERDAKLLTDSRVSLSIDASPTVADCANIIVDFAKSAPAYTLICGHYDSRPCTPGANDNAAGAACVLALIQLLSPHTGIPLRFVFFDGEELGLVGSKFYAASDLMKGCMRVINLDGLGANRLSVLSRDRDAPLDIELAELALKTASKLSINLKSAESRTGTSDHSPLVAKGARALWFSDHPNQGRETDLDVAAAVNMRELQDAVTLVSGVLNN